MIIYNVTSNIHPDVHEEWLDWMQHTHIPEVIATGKFSKARLVKVLVEDHGFTYSVQFYTDSKATLDKYYEEDAPRLRQATANMFGDKVHSFRTELQHISDHKAV
ncbi:MAG TPA: DUF4286 family protein [Flavobacterium sp.]|nr:DUF4286 family protein [Flavobacterium sp.]